MVREKPPDHMDEDDVLFYPTSPYFFKIILHSAIQSGKLVIPMKFIRKYGAGLSVSNVVILKVPNGDSWVVELRKGDDGMVWLQKGWLDFADFYSIKHGHFLVFKYDPVSSNEFDVIVLDPSASEIQYRVKSDVPSSPIKVEDTDEDNDVIHVERNNRPPCLGKKRRRTDRFTEPVTEPPAGIEKHALNRGENFNSSNPYFRVAMQRSHVRPPYKLSVPQAFLQQCLGEPKRGYMKFWISGDKTWTAKYTVYEHGFGRHLKGSIYAGWKAFVKDNNIVFGDVCIFELMSGLKNMSFRITIFRAPRDADPGISKSQAENLDEHNHAVPAGRCNCNRPAMKSDTLPSQASGSGTARSMLGGFPGGESEARGFASGLHPSFNFIVTEGSLTHGLLFMQAAFVRDHMNLNFERKEQMVTLKTEDRWWQVKLISGCDRRSMSPTLYLSAGFRAFLKGNSLKDGDRCTFKLVRRDEMVFEVSICRVKEEQTD